MEIKILKTSEIQEQYWDCYTNNFNNVFNSNKNKLYFKNKYLQTIKGYSYHSLLINKDDIVGSCSVIPVEYYFFKQKYMFGLVVDVFINPEFRQDPLCLFRMYSKLKKYMINENINHIMAVPNDIAYPYWKSVVKWKDIGQIPYYALPLRLGNIIGKYKFINNLSLIYTNTILFLNTLFLLFFNIKSKQKNIRINKENKIIEQQRYTDKHIKITSDNESYFFRLVNEDGVKVAYLIDFYNKNKNKDYRVLLKAIKKIKKEKPDLILFVGKFGFNQLIMTRIPKNKEPKHLYFTGDILNKENISNTILEYKNWDFGLFNYDVR